MYHKLIQFVNCKILRSHSIREDYFLVCEGKIINPAKVFFEEKRKPDIIIDLEGCIVSPGFIDIQINGGFGVDFTHDLFKNPEGLNLVAKGILAYGVTSFCPTLVTSTPQNYQRVLPLLSPRKGGLTGAGILGAHVEGPFINKKKMGAHNAEYISDLSDGPASVLDMYGDLHNIKMVTLAPELENSSEVIRWFVENGIIVCLGHSLADVEVGEEAINSGARVLTHLFNAMLPFHHRNPGLVGLLGTTCKNPVYYGLIPDGIHTHPSSLRIAYRSLPEGAILVTDAISAMGFDEGVHHIGDKQIEIKGNQAFIANTTTLCGSVATMDKCIRFFKESTDCTLVEALEAATLHPAQALGIEKKKGTLSFGSDADFVVLNDKLEVVSTWIGGICVWSQSRIFAPNFRDSRRQTKKDNSSIPDRSEQMGTASQRRAYEYQQRRAVEDNDWSEQRYFEERPDQSKGGKQTSRSQGWKSKFQEKKGNKNDSKPPSQKEISNEGPKKDYRAKKETPEAEPTFDVGYYQASVPTNPKERYAQNFDHSGFITLTEGIYEELLGLDPRVTRSMPYSGFLHTMVQVLNAHILDVDSSLSGNPIGTREYVSDLFGSDALIPAPLYYYLQCYCPVITAAGDSIQPNLPPVCVPSDGLDDRVSGTFGPITAADHNKYESYISPYVTSKRVEASAQGRADWQPLPPEYFPAGATPNENLLGYGPIDILTPEGKSRISGISFPDDGTVSSRLKFNPDLFSRVQTYLKTISDRFKMREIPFSASRSLTRIPPRISNASIEFVECRGSLDTIIRKPNVTVHSYQAFGKGQATQAAVYVSHRHRSATCPGMCYTIGGNPIDGWRDNRNRNFSMMDPFSPNNFSHDYSSLRLSRFQSYGPDGYRSQMIQAWLKQFHVKKKD